MQAVILCAGKSSRFYPLNIYTHKSNISLLGKPIYWHTLQSIKKSGITEVVVVTGPDNFIKDSLGDGADLGLNIKYSIQEEPKGMGDALLQAREHLHERFFVLHPHHIDFAEYKDHMQDKSSDVVLLAKEEEDVTESGVLKIEDGKVTGIVEKPEKGTEPSKLRLIGLYLLSKNFLTTLEASGDDHYNFEKSLTTFMQHNTVEYVTTDKPVVTLKYPWHLLDISKILLKNIKTSISENSEIAQNVVIEGSVIIEDGVKIHSGVILKGPIYIGKNSFIGDNTILRGNVNIESNVVIGSKMEIKNSVIMENSTAHAGYLGDSIIGPDNKIAGFFVTANARLDRGPIHIATSKGSINSRQNRLGVITGKNVTIGARVTSMPGVVIGHNVLIGPNTTVSKNIPDDSKYYTKFSEVIESLGGNRISDKINSEKVVLFDIDYTLFDTKIFKESDLETYELYTEVYDLLDSLRGKVVLGIFSEGELDFQSEKLNRTDINRHFLQENVHIVSSKDEKISDVLNIYKESKIILIDDKLTVLHNAKDIAPDVIAIWVKRGIYAENQQDIEGFSPDIVVDNLKGLDKIILDL